MKRKVKIDVEKKNSYAADFETTCSEYDRAYGHSRVWLYDICSFIGLNHFTGYSIEDFFKSCQALSPCYIYFHNLRFDGNFIISWLLKHDFKSVECSTRHKLRKHEFTTMITDMGIFYTIEVCFEDEDRPIIFRDSAKKIVGKVRDIAIDYGLPVTKGECDYTLYRDDDYKPTMDEIDYVRRDTEIIARVLVMEYDEGMTYITSASDSFNKYKESLGHNFAYLFPQVSMEVDNFIRASYRGGVCQVNPKYKDKEVTIDNVYDVNSMYPHQMCSKVLPYGKPVYFKGRYKQDIQYPLYIQRIAVNFKLKEGMLPTILRNDVYGWGNDSAYLYDSDDFEIELTLTSIDLELMWKHYDIYSIRCIDGYMFHGSTSLFRNYIKPLYEEKCKSKGAKKQLMKILINSLYGKFATNPKHVKKIPYLDENGVVQYKTSDDERDGKPIYTAVSSFITAYARKQLFKAIDDNMGIFIYCDTDSVHLNGKGVGIPVDDKLLGAWKIESDANPVVKAKYLGPKCYYQVLRDKTPDNPRGVNIKVAGAPDEIKAQMEYEDFHIGAKYSGKKIPMLVNGGVILMDMDFQIKPR